MPKALILDDYDEIGNRERMNLEGRSILALQENDGRIKGICYGANPKQRDVFYMQVIEELSRALYKSMSRTDFFQISERTAVETGGVACV